MDKAFFRRQALVAIGGLIFVLLLFHVTDLDMTVQDKLFQFDSAQWLLDKRDPVLRMAFYDGPKTVLTLLAKIALLALILFRSADLIGEYRQGLAIVLLSVAITVAMVGGLKSLTNVPCPNDLSHFGGEYPYVTFLHRVAAAVQLDRVRCFPAGHASGGFALLSLFFLFKRRRNRWIGFGVGMALGWAMGLYKMLIGDHFLSHTLVSMCLAWLVSIFVAAIIYRLSSRSAHCRDNGRCG